MDQVQSILVNNQNIGQYGRFSNKIINEFGYDFPGEVYGFEINLTSIKKMMGKNKIFKKINLYPTIDRDLNFVLMISLLARYWTLFVRLGRQLNYRSKSKKYLF